MDTPATPEAPALQDAHRACFACGVGNDQGMNLHFDTGSDGVAAAVWLPSGAFQSYPDRVHGGVIAILLDCAMVHALFARGVAGVTAELSIRYLQSVTLLVPVEVTGWMEECRHGIYLCRAEVRQAGGVAVRASAKFLALPAGADPVGKLLA